MAKSYNPYVGKGDYKQGIFEPKNPDKYKGTLPIVFRSSYELKFMRYCDYSPNVQQWGSESVIVQYFDPVSNKTRRYFTDFVITVKLPSGEFKKMIIEVKPYKQTIEPAKNKKNKLRLMKEQRMYITNMAKWSAATDVCKKNGWIFKILTEKDLGIS